MLIFEWQDEEEDKDKRLCREEDKRNGDSFGFPWFYVSVSIVVITSPSQNGRSVEFNINIKNFKYGFLSCLDPSLLSLTISLKGPIYTHKIFTL